MLSVTNVGGGAVTGNAMAYNATYRWNRPSTYNTFTLSTARTTCTTISVTELKSGASFNAQTFDNRPQVRTGHSASHAGVV